jgi:cytoskeletal protein CcmA (bactofilin family)
MWKRDQSAIPPNPARERLRTPPPNPPVEPVRVQPLETPRVQPPPETPRVQPAAETSRVQPAMAPRDTFTEAPRVDRAPGEGVVMNLGKSVVIKGELSGSEDLTLSGQMEGSITLAGHTLTIGSGADVKAQISAKTVVIMGAVTGNITAAEKVEVQATGSVTGDIVSQRLVIADGGSVCGKVEVPHSNRSHTAKK